MNADELEMRGMVLASYVVLESTYSIWKMHIQMR